MEKYTPKEWLSKIARQDGLKEKSNFFEPFQEILDLIHCHNKKKY